MIGGTSKKDNTDVSRSQPFLPLVLVNTPKLYRIKKTVWLENNIKTLNNAIDVESTNNSDRDNSAPFFGKYDGAEIDFCGL